MFLLVILTVLEVATRTYDFFNPYCKLKHENVVYSDVPYETKAKICESWLSLLWFWDPDTGLYVVEPNQHKATVNINSFGFRGPEIPQEKPEGTYRIFVVGGSTTISLRAPSDDLTHPGFLQERFDNAGLDFKVEVINAGVPSFASTQELTLVQKKLINFAPDLIIIYDGSNDINLPYGYTPAKTDLRSVIADGFNRYVPFWETVPVIYHYFSSSKENPTSYDFDDSDVPRKASLWKENLKTVCQLGNQNGFETVIALQPILGTGKKQLTEHERNQHRIFNHDKVVPAYDLFYQEMEELSKHCTKTADLRDVFDNVTDDVYFDNTHVGYQNNKIIADRIYEEILPIVLEKHS